MPDVLTQVVPKSQMPYDVYGRELQQGPGRMAEGIYGVSTPNILNQIYQRYRGQNLFGTPWQSASLQQIPSEAVRQIGPLLFPEGVPIKGDYIPQTLEDFFKLLKDLPETVRTLRTDLPRPTITEAAHMQNIFDQDLERYVKSEVAAGRPLDPQIKRAWDSYNARWARQDAELQEKAFRQKQELLNAKVARERQGEKQWEELMKEKEAERRRIP